MSEKEKAIPVQVQKAIEALEKNRMAAYYVPTADEVVPLVKTLLTKGETVAVGGSQTLKQTGVLPLLQGGDYRFVDRYAADLTAEQREERLRAGFSADTFFTSANAITLQGELYNVDGTSNRIAAIAYGPKSVIVVAGINKLVPTLQEAILRVKQVAAPANVTRLERQTPCAKTGACYGCEGDMPAGCQSEQRICSNYLVSAWQPVPNRIKVILVGEPLGY